MIEFGFFPVILEDLSEEEAVSCLKGVTDSETSPFFRSNLRGKEKKFLLNWLHLFKPILLESMLFLEKKRIGGKNYFCLGPHGSIFWSTEFNISLINNFMY